MTTYLEGKKYELNTESESTYIIYIPYVLYINEYSLDTLEVEKLLSI